MSLFSEISKTLNGGKMNLFLQTQKLLKSLLSLEKDSFEEWGHQANSIVRQAKLTQQIQGNFSMVFDNNFIWGIRPSSQLDARHCPIRNDIFFSYLKTEVMFWLILFETNPSKIRHHKTSPNLGQDFFVKKSL